MTTINLNQLVVHLCRRLSETPVMSAIGSKSDYTLAPPAAADPGPVCGYLVAGILPCQRPPHTTGRHGGPYEPPVVPDDRTWALHADVRARLAEHR